MTVIICAGLLLPGITIMAAAGLVLDKWLGRAL